jgi:prepilin-type N-terminal cleavage/methylation domain-containing protein
MLARIRKAMEKRDEGFTLIELLVVMIIIGILAAIAIPVFLSQKKKAYESSLKADLNTIADDIGTAQVDDPTSITVAAGDATASPWNVDITPTPGSKITVSLSPNNQLQKAFVDESNGGAYCVSLANSNDATNVWAAYSDSTGSHVAKGTCDGTTATFTPAS